MFCVQGGTVVNADRQFKSDVLIVDGSIAEVGENLQVPSSCSAHPQPFALTYHPSTSSDLFQMPAMQVPVNARVLDATGKLVMPGGPPPASLLPWCLAADAHHHISCLGEGFTSKATFPVLWH